MIVKGNSKTKLASITEEEDIESLKLFAEEKKIAEIKFDSFGDSVYS